MAENKFLIGASREEIVALIPLPQTFSKEDALLLAAWIVAIVGDEEKWQEILAEVRDA